MSTLNNVNPTVIATAIRTPLAADATLAGASYLNGSNKIWTNRSPSDATRPYLVIEVMQVYPNGFSQFRCEARIHCYATLLSNGQLDTVGNKILARCQELLNDEDLTISGMTVQPGFQLSVVPSYYDEEIECGHGVVRLQLELGYN